MDKRKEDLSSYQQLKNTESGACYIVGSGPSLDKISDINALVSETEVFVVNASIILFNSANWVFKNMCAYEQTLPYLAHFPKRIFTRHTNANRFSYPDAEIFYFNESLGEAYGKHTTATAAARIAYHLGYRTLYLLGIDCRETPGKPYAEALKFQHCIYETPKKQHEYFYNFIYDWQLLKNDLVDAKIMTMSPDFPPGIFEYQEIEKEFRKKDNP